MIRRSILVGLAIVLAAVSAPGSGACSILTLRNESKVLMGNNEDFVEAGWIWFSPASSERFGRVNFGFANRFVQGSMNDRGLSFDAAVVPEMSYRMDPDKPDAPDLLDRIMDECATVAEAIDYFERHNCRHLSRTQFLFADASGDSAIVSWRPETGLTVQRIEGPHQIATNTRLDGTGYRCARYTKAERLLSQRASGDVSVDAVAEVLGAIHQRGPGAYTTYSTIYDLKARKVYVYNHANFDEAVEIDLARELAQGGKRRKLAKLFQQSPDEKELRAGPQREDFGTRVELASAILDRYAGFYSPEPTPEITVRVTRDGGNLRVSSPEGPGAILVPESDTRFRLVPDRGEVSFQLAADGSVRGMTLHRQADVYAPRVDPPRTGRED